MYLSRSFKILFFAILCLAGVPGAQAQAPKGFTPLANATELQDGLAKATKATQTIASDFSQVKHMKMMDDKVNSKGRFFFKKEDRIRIEYTSPFQYLLVMNGGQIMVKDENKSNKINTRNSKTMQSANRVMMDCMRGTVFGNKDFTVKSYSGGNQYLLELVPVNAAMKGLFARIHVYIAKNDFSVTKLVMTENGGDYTDMTFTNKKINTTLADALFSVR
ncbi:LolA family protein [Taibaiella chishuiensis]|uniref:Outer membrane lipoprotein-sorting protein n=1 Tax=Taibaiella chishuiensis TaxID=1434707 RepID=A0A2P8CSU5_9BACT|nr:outer membrane lipoprotein carrier protein LolA [Taibaiella chishuiensis]PSK88034.1 outer membrane lipoprotein-sorting protein [Taibaiella chishuiensis]